MKFDYYYGNQAEQFSFIKIPRMLLLDPTFAPLSIQSKLLYGVLLDRMGLSMRNGWFDEENRVYIIYQISEIQDDLGFSKRKAIDYLTELEQFGLVEKKRRGRGLPSILYIKSFMMKDAENLRSTDSETSEADETENRSIENGTSDGNGIDIRSTENSTSGEVNSKVGSAENNTSEEETIRVRSAKNGTSCKDVDAGRSAEIDTSRSSQIALQEVQKSTLLEVQGSTPLKSNNNINNTEFNNTISSNLILSKPEEDEMGYDGMSLTEAYREIIQENISYNCLKERYPYDGEMLDGIVDLILEAVMNQSETMMIASATYPTELVKSRFLKLNSQHIQYVMDCFNKNTTKVGNIKKYLMTALFNAPSTIGGYYTAEVHHDMPYLARG